jgi:lipopolysaccharide export system protein LptC
METNFFSGKNLFKNLSLFAAVVVLIVAAILFYQHFYDAKHQQVTIEIPSTIATGIEVTQMNEQGQPLHRLFSNTAHDYRKQQRTLFTSPVGYLYQANQPPWIMSADQAISSGDNTLVNFSGNVKIHQAAGKANKATTLTTTQMTLLPQKNIAYNDVFTTADQGGLVITSIGFHADLNKNEVKLLSKTNVTYTQTN